jgi:hypothetical protein
MELNNHNEILTEQLQKKERSIALKVQEIEDIA